MSAIQLWVHWIFTDYNIKFLFHRTLLKSRKVPCIQCLYSRKNAISPFLLQDNAHFHSHCYIDQSFLAESSGLFLLKTFVHHTSYGCMVWFTNAKQANIRRETYTSQLMKPIKHLLNSVFRLPAKIVSRFSVNPCKHRIG